MKRNNAMQILALRLGRDPYRGAIDIYREFVCATEEAVKNNASEVIIPISSAVFISALLETDAEELEEELSE